MSTYRIYFFGLIFHIEFDGKGHSAAVWDDDHRPTLIWSQTEAMDLRGVGAVTFTASDLHDAPARRIDFDRYVPSVKGIMGGGLEGGAKTGTGNGATYVHHVGGTLSVAALYKHPAQHIRSDLNGKKPTMRSGCIASATILELTSAGPVTLTAGDATRQLEPDSCVLIANFDLPTKNHHDAENDPHFRKYSQLTNGSNTRIVVKEETEKRCSAAGHQFHCNWVSDIIYKASGFDAGRTSLHSECGNSAWP